MSRMETVISLLRLVCVAAVAGQPMAPISPAERDGLRVRLCGREPTPPAVTIPLNNRKPPTDDDGVCHAPCLQAMRRDAKNCCAGLGEAS